MEQVVPLDKIPVYVKENAIIPMGPEMEYIGQKEDDQWEIHCYPMEGKGRLCSYEHGFTVEMKVFVLGTGGWGIALAMLLHQNGHEPYLCPAQHKTGRSAG